MNDVWTKEQLARRVEATHRANQNALRRTAHRGERLDRAARQSVRIVERAVRKLRTGA